MDLYQNTLDYLLAIPAVTSWPEMERIVRQVAARRPYDWRLPVLACEAVGGERQAAIAVAAAVASLQISIILVDDLLDNDPRGEQQRLGAATVANLAVAFHAVSLEAIARDQASGSEQVGLMKQFNRMALRTALGQAWDASNKTGLSYWQLVQAKSAPFFSTALYAGARTGGATPGIARQLARLGTIYGEIIQIQDDMKDVMTSPAGPDWKEGRFPLPILYAEAVAHGERERFLQLRQTMATPEALAEAQTILIRCGAISYCIDQMLRRYHSAQRKLDALPLANPAPLQSMLQPLLEPIEDLFRKTGGSVPLASEYDGG